MRAKIARIPEALEPRRRARRARRRAARGDARGARADAEPPARRRPASSTTCASPARSPTSSPRTSRRRRRQRRRQAADPRGVRRRRRACGSCSRWCGRQLEVLRVKKEISSHGAGGDGQDPARVHPPPADEERSRRSSARAATTTRSRSCASASAARSCPPEAEKVAKKQLARLARMQQQSAEYNVTAHVPRVDRRSAVVARPRSDKLDVADVRRCLDEDHFGLEKVKKRIVEYIAVRKLRTDKKGPILLLHRPARRRQDVARSIDRARDGPPLRAHLARRRARRGRDPRPPPHVRRRAPGPHHPGA